MQHQNQHQNGPPRPYHYGYSVNDPVTANHQSHESASDGDVTRGEYRVLLPDGRTQIVKYTADAKNGYNAQVSTLLWSFKKWNGAI